MGLDDGWGVEVLEGASIFKLFRPISTARLKISACDVFNLVERSRTF